MGCSYCQTPNERKLEMITEQELEDNDSDNKSMEKTKASPPGQVKIENKNEEKVNEKIEFDKSNFSEALFGYMNAARTKPTIFADSFEKYIPSIINNGDGTYSLDIPGQTNGKLILKYGEESFKNTMLFLRSMIPIEPLTYDPDLELNSEYDEKTSKSIKYISSQLNQRISDLNGRYTKFSLNIDQDILDPELAVVIQVIENIRLNSDKKRNVFSHEYTHLGVTSVKGNNTLISYVVFAK